MLRIIKYITTLLLTGFILLLATPVYDKPLLRIKVINLWKRFQLADFAMLNEILTERYTIEMNNYRYDMILDGVAGRRKKTLDPDPKIIKIFYTGESVRPQIENYDLSIGFDYIDDPRYMRIPYYHMHYGKAISSSYRPGECRLRDKTAFACFLVSNAGGNNLGRTEGCSARNRMFHKLSEYQPVQSGGNFLNNQNRVIPKAETMSFLSQCKFTIAYENTAYAGYITEKPFQAYFAETIPIYYGHETALADINKQAIIYAGDFTTEDQLLDYVKKLDQDDASYCKIWNQQLMNDPEKDYAVIAEELAGRLYRIIDEKL